MIIFDKNINFVLIHHIKILQGHEGAIYKIHFDPNRRKLYSVGGDGWLVEWDVDHSDNGVLLARVPDQLFSLAVTPDHYLLGSFQGNFYVLDRENKSILYQERVHQKGIFSILAADSEDPVAKDCYYTFGGDGKIILWNANTFEKVNEWPVSNRSIRTQALHPDGDRLAVGCSDGCIYIMRFPEMYLQKQINAAHNPSVFALLWDRDTLISGGRDALLKTWKVSEDYAPDRSLNAHWYAIYELLQTPDYLVTASRDKSIRWWDRSSLQALGTIKWGDVMQAHVHSVNTLAYDSVKKVLYSGSEDRTIRLWRIDSPDQ